MSHQPIKAKWVPVTPASGIYTRSTVAISSVIISVYIIYRGEARHARRTPDVYGLWQRYIVATSKLKKLLECSPILKVNRNVLYNAKYYCHPCILSTTILSNREH